MFVRKIGAMLGATALVASGVALAMGPASADPAPGVVPGAKDVVGVGSDTTQIVMQKLADNYNSVVAGHAGDAGAGAKLYSYDACTIPAGAYYPCNVDTNTDLTLRTGSPARVRPNGSGAGMKALGSGGSANDFPEVSYARSSSALDDAAVAAGLVAFPYAVDGLDMVTSTTTNAPANLTASQILSIYNGNYTNWSQVGGKDGPIHAYIPQSGSGTGKFFIAQLKTIPGASTTDTDNYSAAKNTADPSAPGVDCSTACPSIQEHDPTYIKDDPNAIAPFSVGREKLINGSSPVIKKASTSFSPIRAVYNILRTKNNSADSTHPDNAAWYAGTAFMKSIFGTAGYLCSPAAKTIIEAQGFSQLKRVADGGACGVTVSTSGGTPSTLAAYSAGSGKLAPKVGATVTSGRYGLAHTVAVTVLGTAGLVPTGSVKITVHGTSYTRTLSATGKASVSAWGLLSAYSGYDVAISYSGDRNFNAGTGHSKLTVTKIATTTTASPTVAKPRTGHSQNIAIAVRGVLRPTGQVAIYHGSTRVTSVGTLSNGNKTLNISAARIKTWGKGVHVHLTVKYLGATNFGTSSRTITLIRQ